jgi:hypothetical protein
MGVLDRVLLLLLMSPFLLVAFGVAMNVLEEARHHSNTAKRVALKLAALGVASLALGFTFFIVTDDDGHWCTKEYRNDPGCMHHGGE